MGECSRLPLSLGKQPNRLFCLACPGGEDEADTELPGLIPDILECPVVAVLVVEDDKVGAFGNVGSVAIFHVFQVVDRVSAFLDFFAKFMGLGAEQSEREDAHPVIRWLQWGGGPCRDGAWHSG